VIGYPSGKDGAIARFKTRKTKPNMAARGFYRARSLLYCWARNSLMKEALLHRTTVNSVYLRKIVLGIQCFFLSESQLFYSRRTPNKTLELSSFCRFYLPIISILIEKKIEQAENKADLHDYTIQIRR